MLPDSISAHLKTCPLACVSVLKISSYQTAMCGIGLLNYYECRHTKLAMSFFVEVLLDVEPGREDVYKLIKYYPSADSKD